MPEESNQQAGTQETAQAIAQIREQWGPATDAMVAACRGNAEALAQLEPFLNQMALKEDWRALVGVLRRILAGERDPLTVLHGLDDTDTVIVGDVLRGLGLDVPLAGLEEEDDGKMVSLEDFFQRALRACAPDAPAGLADQMLAATRGMATQANLSPELRELGQVLNQILSGKRNPDLSVLHPRLAERVRQMLTELE